MEVKPTYRKKGVAKKLTTQLLNFLKDKGVCVVDLQCSPETSEPVWKRLGFVEFPDAPESDNLNSDDIKRLFSILTEHLPTSSCHSAHETIELWNEEPYTTDENTPPVYIWNLEYVNGTRKLSKPIIHPAHYEWRMRWRINGKTIVDDKVKRFKTKIDFWNFIIIDELSLPQCPPNKKSAYKTKSKKSKPRWPVTKDSGAGIIMMVAEFGILLLGFIYS